VIPVRPNPADHVIFAIAALRKLAERCVVLCCDDYVETMRLLLADRPQDTLLVLDTPVSTIAAGYQKGLIWLWSQGEALGDVILTGSHVIGPLLPLDPRSLDLTGAQAEMFSPYWHNPAIDIRFEPGNDLGLLPSLDFAVLSAKLMQNDAFRAVWTKFKPSADYWQEFQGLRLDLAAMLKAEGMAVLYPVMAESLETFDPSTSEIHKLIASNVPCLPLSVLRMDPVLHDLYSIDLRGALDHLRIHHAQVYKLVIAYASHNIPPRDFAMATDAYEVLSHTAVHPGKSKWSFGRIAVFIHAYYAEMMPEFWILLQRIPCGYDLFVTTSNPKNRDQIEAYLNAVGVDPSARQVEVVAHNRGRDMSSLFITFKEQVLSGKYKVALRLHSKRTPQVSRQVGENFKKHLFENLVGSRGYVSNLLDRFEQESDIGMIMPPIVHIGLGTLGHSWFNNRQPLMTLAKKMGLEVNFDPDTPVAPLGTMYWFRPEALSKMFETPWAWEDYNPEPRHIDGGLAHVQERLICYVCIDKGFRVLMTMTPEQAGRNYAKLEYKLQLLASRLASGNVQIQRNQLDQLGQTFRNSFVRRVRSTMLQRLMAIYSRILLRYPNSRRSLRPIGHFVRRILRSDP
jgi:lipopolysaccharide biosynthesis protein